jgi:hypothetical protein
MKNLEIYEMNENDESGLIIMPHGQIAMAIRGYESEYCMMMNLGTDFDGMCIPMGYWIVPEFDVPNQPDDHWIMIDPVSEFWIVNNTIHYNYDAIVGCTLLDGPRGY